MSDADRENYNRGHLDGGIAERLSSHDRHFTSINGSLERIDHRLETLASQIQRLGDQAISRDATVITTAAALKDADSARRDMSSQRWSPWARMAAAAGGLAAIVSIVGGIYIILR